MCIDDILRFLSETLHKLKVESAEVHLVCLAERQNFVR